MRIAQHGAGYVGLTSAVHLAMAGHEVLIYDPDERTVDGVNAGTPRAGEFLSYLDVSVRALVDRRVLRATTHRDEVAAYHTHFVAVPTERDAEPHDAIVLETLKWIYKHAVDRSVIIVESTLTPGTIDRFLAKNAYRAVGLDYFLAVAPRRDWFASQAKSLKNLPRIVGGVTPACTKFALDILATVCDTILPTDYRTAELTKSIENTLLHLPVAFAEQLAAAMPDRNIAEAIRLACTHWRLMDIYLSCGIGGRCIPLAPMYLDRATDGQVPIVTAALEFDHEWRHVIAEAIAARAEPGKRVLVLGIAYRPQFKDAGLSPGLAIAKHLALGARAVEVHDPMWSWQELAALTGLTVMQHERELVPKMDAILLATPHEQYLSWPKDAWRWRAGQFVLDGQGAWAEHRELFRSYGVEYRRIGEPGWRG